MGGRIMSNIEIILIIIMAMGFAYVSSKLNKVMDMCSLIIQVQLGGVDIKYVDDEEDEY